MAPVINSSATDFLLKSLDVFAEKAPITATTVSFAKDFFGRVFSEEQEREVQRVSKNINAKIIEGMQWGYWKKVASAVKNFFVHGFSWEKAVSSPHLLFRALPEEQKLALLGDTILYGGRVYHQINNMGIKGLWYEYGNLKIEEESISFTKSEDSSDSVELEQVSLSENLSGVNSGFCPPYVEKLLKNCWGSSIEDLPILDLSGYQGSTGYISYIKPEDMSAPIMRFRDAWDRPGIAFAIRGKEDSKRSYVLSDKYILPVSKMKGVLTLHKRYFESSDPNCWVVGGGSFIPAVYQERQWDEAVQKGEKGISYNIFNSGTREPIHSTELEALLSGTDPDFILGIGTSDVLIPWAGGYGTDECKSEDSD